MMNAVVPSLEIETVALEFDHSEGICLAPGQSLYLGGELGQVCRVESDMALTEICPTGGLSLGLAEGADGKIYVWDPGHHCVWNVDPRTGKFDVYFSGSDGVPMREPNWGCFDEEGNFYVSDSGDWGDADGLIWKVLDGGKTEVWTHDCKGFPNGMCLSADGRTLYVVESTPSELVAFDIESDGSAGSRRVVAELPDAVPDGVAVTTDGRFVVACHRPDVVLLVDNDENNEVLVKDPQGTSIAAPTNVSFVGENLEEIVVPNFDRWHVSHFEMPGVCGIPLRYLNLPDCTECRRNMTNGEKIEMCCEDAKSC